MQPVQPDLKEMKAERTQFDLSLLDGWVPINGSRASAIREQKIEGLWTALEMTDHLEACETVAELGRIAEPFSVTPDLDVRGKIVYVTIGAEHKEVTRAEFEFALEVDRQLGDGSKCQALVGK